jgi:hypothetical protein
LLGTDRRLATALAVVVGIVSYLLIIQVRVGLGFMAAAGIVYWVRDVRNRNGEQPKWLNLAIGAVVWLGLAVAALSLRGWADQHFSHVDISIWAGLALALAAFFVSFGLWIYLRVPSDRAIARWQQMPWDLGALCGLLPGGVAILLMFIALALIPSETWAQLIFFVGGGFAVVALILFVWQPVWIKPGWMKEQE